jgi:hypothetical protein
MSLDLITIKREPIEVVHSLRKHKVFTLHTTTLPALNEQIGKVVAEFINEGLPLHRLSFECGENDDGSDYIYCKVMASRMETPEEAAARVDRQERYNERQVTEHKQKIEQSQRRKELERVTGHLTVEQLKALEPVKPKEQS